MMNCKESECSSDQSLSHLPNSKEHAPLHRSITFPLESETDVLVLHRELPSGDSDYRSFHRSAAKHSKNRLFTWLALGSSFLLVVLVALASYRTSYTRRHPLQYPHRRLHDTSLKYLTLGGASTWGVGLSHPEPRATLDGGVSITEAAYPYRLSVDVHNAAQRFGGPTLAALCSASIVDDHIYDVITLEFSNDTYQAHDLAALLLLAQRLRQRFPAATIVFVQVWSPSQYRTVETGMDFASWRLEQLTTTENQNWETEFWQDSISEHTWTYNSQAHQANAKLQEIAHQVQGRVVNLAAPQDPQRGLETANKWFVEVVSGG